MNSPKRDNHKATPLHEHLTLCQININGLSKHSLTSLEKFIFYRSINIVALQETKVDTLPKQQFTGLSTFINNSGLGVGIAVSNHLKPQHVPELDDTECSIIWVSTSINGISTLISSAYCAPETTSTRSLHNLLENIKKAKHYADNLGIKNLLIMGDFNARSSKWGDRCENPRGRLLNKFADEFIDCSILSPSENTFVTPHGGSIIDLCLVFGPLHMDMGTPQVDSRDVHELFTGAPLRGHLPVINTIRNKHSQTKKVNTTFNYDEADWRSWRAELDLIFGNKLHEIESSTAMPSCASLVAFFQSSVLKACNNHIPTKKCCIHSKPYWSDNLTMLSNKLRNAQNIFLGRASPYHKKNI